MSPVQRRVQIAMLLTYPANIIQSFTKANIIHSFTNANIDSFTNANILCENNTAKLKLRLYYATRHDLAPNN